MPYGTIETVKIVKEKLTQRSLGYGFVKFSTGFFFSLFSFSFLALSYSFLAFSTLAFLSCFFNPLFPLPNIVEDEANAAITALNGRQIESKTLRVSVAKQTGGGNEKQGNLYVAGLEPHISQEDLQTIFQPYGTITEVKILTDKATNTSRGVGFVKYEQPGQADAAIQALNGVTLAGTSKPLTVRVADKKDDKSAVPMANAAYGRGVRYNPMGYYPPGYQMPGYQGYPGYQVSLFFFFFFFFSFFRDLPPIFHLIFYFLFYFYFKFFIFHCKKMGGPPAQQMAQQMPQQGGNTPSFGLFIYNLPPESDENYLYQLFGPYGAVAQVKVVRDPATNLCKGFGFVNFVKVEDAQSAIAALNGAQIGTKTLQVSFKKDK